MTVPRPEAYGFYAILDTGYVDESAWETKAEALLLGGAKLLQVRAKGHPLEWVLELVKRVQPIASHFQVPLIVNDHLEIAREVPGTGLHLGQEDGSVKEARKALGNDRIIGLSTHSLDQARAAIELQEVLSYFAVGPVFRTGTKPAYEPVGTELVAEVARISPSLPFYAIGGINRENLDQVLQAGARGIVAVSDPLQANDTREATHAYVKALQNRAHA